jgi:hypothetical protein
MPELSLKTQNAEALARVEKEQRKMQKREQVLAFAKEQLGLSGKRAKALRKLGAAYFKLDTDGLKFRGAGDKLVAVDSKQCTDFFAKKFDFLLGGNDGSQVVEHGALNDADIALARAGNLTAKGRVLLALNGDEAALRAALADKGTGTDKVALTDKTLDKSKNPFVGLRDPRTGKIVPEKMARVESFIKAAGTKAAASVARSAGLRLDGSPIDPKYL